MKKILTLIVIFYSVAAISQPVIAVSDQETVSLLFPFPILHVDRGAKDVLVQQPKEVDHILLLKASTPAMAPTNISVIVGDGSVYAFKVVYARQPKKWIYELPPLKQATIQAYANAILVNPGMMRGPLVSNGRVTFRIRGLYIKNEVLYCHLQLYNYSPLDYDIELLRFYIKDKKKGKRTASQENELTILHTAGNVKLIKAKTGSVVVVALPRFTIPDAKYFQLEMMEKNGGRHMKLKLQNKHIFRARPLPDLQ